MTAARHFAEPVEPTSTPTTGGFELAAAARAATAASRPDLEIPDDLSIPPFLKREPKP
jgi:hypothetical protein